MEVDGGDARTRSATGADLSARSGRSLAPWFALLLLRLSQEVAFWATWSQSRPCSRGLDKPSPALCQAGRKRGCVVGGMGRAPSTAGYGGLRVLIEAHLIG